METKVFLESILKDQEIHPVVIQDGKCQKVITLDEEVLASRIGELSKTSKILLKIRVRRRRDDMDYLFKHTEIGRNVTTLEYEKRKMKNQFWQQAYELCAKYW